MRDVANLAPCISCGKCLTLLFKNEANAIYISDTPANGWVGVDMGKPVSVDKIAYKPRNDDNIFKI